MIARTSLWLAIPFALALPIGCNSGGSTTTPGTDNVAEAPAAETASASAAAADTSNAVDASSPHANRKHHHKGIVKEIFHAAKQLDLSADEKSKVETIMSQLHADGASLKAPEQALHAALIAGVRAGSIDMTKIAPLQAAVKSAHQAHQAKEAVALNSLWSTLQATERTTLVANLRAKENAKEERWAQKHQAEDEVPAGSWQTRKIEHLTTDLSLDSTQQASVTALIAKQPTPTTAGTPAEHFAAMKAHRETVLNAFASDTFDARTLKLGEHMGAPAGASGAAAPGPGPGLNHAQFLASLVPILRADQRETLATKMESHQKAEFQAAPEER